MKCACGAIIPKERLEILPDTKTCVKCSQAKKKIGIIAKGASLDVIDYSQELINYTIKD
jgi:RNA polymerase-binding transcription factor DksA